MSVSLNEVVRLQCPEASHLAQRHWERPNSRLSPDLYLQLEDGSLRFVATPVTLGHYLCLSSENGYQQTLAIYQVKQKSSPTPQAPTTTSTHPQTRPLSTTPAGGQGLPTLSVEAWPKRTETRQREPEPTSAASETQVTTRRAAWNLTLWPDQSGRAEVELRSGEHQLLARGPSYLKELVVVSVLLALCLSVLITMALYGIRQRCRSRTAPQANAPARDSERGTSGEREALRGGQSPRSKRNGQALHNGQANGVVCSGTPKGSNGHLPNIPL